MYTNNEKLPELMRNIQTGKLQLPDFQRGWIWDDYRIKALIASIIKGFPVGAAMFLNTSNENIQFKSRPIEGVENISENPDNLILDGQQRLTSIFSSLFNNKPVITRTDKGKAINRFYYINIEKALNDDEDIIDAIISVPEDRKVKTNFNRDIKLDLSTQEREFENRYFPLNIILDFDQTLKWLNDYISFYNHSDTVNQEHIKFLTKITNPTLQYQIPVIYLDSDTKKEAVCQVFENVNTGGVTLTVFELVTAIFAMDDFELRRDWEKINKDFSESDILTTVRPGDFLIACTLLSSYLNKKTVTAKKKDVLNLKVTDYKNYSRLLIEGFKEANRILQEEKIYKRKDLPYSAQLTPLAVICAILIKNNALNLNAKKKIKQWYWNGVFGELYGSATEDRYANDIVDVIDWINGSENLPKTIRDAYFSPQRLLTLKTRNSAAYKGLMAKVLENKAKDFINGREIDMTNYFNDYIDIHHIFPKKYCIKNNLPEHKWNSIVNKTPISYKSNRKIGGLAPSKYLNKIIEDKEVSRDDLSNILNSHFINEDYLFNDDFDNFFIDRSKAMLDCIEEATGKVIQGRDSEEVINSFGGSLI